MNLLLTTLHAKYSHASLALPCLAAFCRDLSGLAISIREYTVNEPHEQVLRHIVSENSDVIAFSCYIWNIQQTLRLASDLRKIAPDTVIILGGPEVSFGTFELMQLNPAVDFVIKGEGEAVLRALLGKLLEFPPSWQDEPHRFANIANLFYREDADITSSGHHGGSLLALDSIPSPFVAGLVDLGRPLTYYETSRGCPFSCAFCLSSVDRQVRSFALPRIESDLELLMSQNVSQIKLVDRTFNYDARRANRIWEFILEHNRCSHFHFEIAADLLTDDNIRLLSQVPPNTFRFEIGIQSGSQDTLEKVARNADLERIRANVRRLRQETSVELHLDLVAGLPGEDYHGLLESLQLVADLKPHVIQIEPLKVLKGSPMREIAHREEYRYSDSPPYTILNNPWLSFTEICRIETIGRLLDLFHNQGGFANALRFMEQRYPFAVMMDRMARHSAGENLTGLNLRRTYELLARLAAPLLSESDSPGFHDALFFDYCSREMPQQGKLPEFIAQRQQECSWPGRRELPPGLALPPNSRVRMFQFRFLGKYCEERVEDGPATVTFVYAAAAGEGLRIYPV